MICHANNKGNLAARTARKVSIVSELSTAEPVAAQVDRLVRQFQCPGCVAGCDTTCGAYKWSDAEMRCTGHVLGTMIGLGNSIALGLPKGFCKPGIDWSQEPLRARNTMDIRLWIAGTKPEWNRLNVPVWAMVDDGFLFVRTFAPRVNMSWVDVIEGGDLSMVPNAINVGEFVSEID